MTLSHSLPTDLSLFFLDFQLVVCTSRELHFAAEEENADLVKGRVRCEQNGECGTCNGMTCRGVGWSWNSVIVTGTLGLPADVFLVLKSNNRASKRRSVGNRDLLCALPSHAKDGLGRADLLSPTLQIIPMSCLAVPYSHDSCALGRHLSGTGTNGRYE